MLHKIRLVKKFYVPDGLKKRSKKIMDILNNVQNQSWHSPDFRKQHICEQIKQGSSASKTKSLSLTSGYIRLFADKTAPLLSNDFYKCSDKKASIHPIENRPFTIREGARLNGLTDDFTWDSNLSKKTVAQLIYNSVSPILGYHIGKSLEALL